ncbi:hypothetical protein D3C84_1034330 [compost metagenome]
MKHSVEAIMKPYMPSAGPSATLPITSAANPISVLYIGVLGLPRPYRIELLVIIEI